jgi:hypothetical protein
MEKKHVFRAREFRDDCNVGYPRELAIVAVRRDEARDGRNCRRQLIVDRF